MRIPPKLLEMGQQPMWADTPEAARHHIVSFGHWLGDAAEELAQAGQEMAVGDGQERQAVSRLKSILPRLQSMLGEVEKYISYTDETEKNTATQRAEPVSWIQPKYGIAQGGTSPGGY